MGASLPTALAVTAGFEPAKRFTTLASLAGRYIRPTLSRHQSERKKRGHPQLLLA